MSQSNTDIVDTTAEEQKLTALEYQSEAWAGEISNGIEPEILAEAAFDTTLRNLLKNRSEKEALKLLSRMRDKVVMGEFSDNKTMQ